ncbi:MAG: GNAT family N-acetyltransferase [Gammaproteobacteria bacterium]|nr:GNAT family N-acetyltransferase [Gammaproteobacteria bacterium]
MHLVFRKARHADLRDLLTMLDEGSLIGGHNPAPAEKIPPSINQAFDSILASPDNDLIVVELDGEIVGMMQLTIIPGISFNGSPRLMIEAVRVRTTHRNRGIGRQMLSWAIEQAREKNCRLIQLQSNKQRTDAARFYQSLGFEMSHNGFKLQL